MRHHGRLRAGILGALLVLCSAGCGGGGGGAASSSTPELRASSKIGVSSPAFADDGTIPRRYTCDGENVSPPLDLSGVPQGAAGLVVLVEDPDAPGGTFVHWTVWGIDPHETALAAGAVPRGAVQGRNGFGKLGYGGPCPPEGKAHHYVFSVFAADVKPTLPEGAAAGDVKRALAGHVTASGTLVGRYGR
ncbi:YbhB/YbcL family Raf kinase inhibitor-like protein [Streptomyces sp. NPDC005813]|uniref:YbhB/YbcL family Raf kinase inhibitor-like protein n=1 Tax=Streptomyces sp. NPDC005813 TaxID=3155592 RepID=UPI0033E047B6